MIKRRNRVRRQRASVIERLENRSLLAGLVAYNGLFSSDATAEHTTFYSDVSGRDAAGPLVDIETGEASGILLTTAQDGVNFGGNGRQPAEGTDAYDIFNGYVDFSAGGEKSIEISGTDTYGYTFENLDSGATYEFAGTAVRGNAFYTNRWTLVELRGVDAASPAHSTGSGVVTTGLPSNQVAIWTGNNQSFGQGFVAQWIDIDPGADGRFQVISKQYTGPVPTSIDSDGVADGSKGYGIAGIRLVENVPAGPPVIENVAPSDVAAFEATVGGRVTTTGGQIPNITLYYGATDGGTNPASWQNSMEIGKERVYSKILDDLDQNTTYYFRSYAENTLGSDWADSSLSFTTLTAGPPKLEMLPATNVGAYAAELAGNILDTGNDPPIVTVYYGDNDGGTNAGAWDKSAELDVQTGSFAAFVTDLQPTSQYYFRGYAQNGLGNMWSSRTYSFETTDTPPLQLSEFMTDNATTLRTRVRATPTTTFRGDQLTPDWIEIQNPTAVVADVGGYYLTDDVSEPTKWEIPAGTLIPGNGFLIVFASGLDIKDSRLDEKGSLHTNFELGSSAGGDVALMDAEGVVISSLENLPTQSEDISFGVDAAGTERFYAVATPGEDNANDFPKAPQITVPSRTFTGSVQVEIVPAAANHTIRYTTDERTPTTSSTVYNGPINITSTTQLRAISVGPNGKASTVVGESYVELSSSVANDTSDLPIVLVDTFGDGIPGAGSSFGDAFFAFIEPGEDGKTRLTDEFDVWTRGGIHVRGSSSSGFAKKQYRVELWDQQDEDQKYEILGMPREADWIFYGPGQYDRSLLANPLMYDLSNQMGRYATRTRWVEMYLNRGGTVGSSDYVGVYAIMEVIEQGNDRVDVEPLTTGAGGVPVEGGFIWKNDRGSAYVDPDSTTSAQRRYIDGWIRDLRSAAARADFKDPERGYAAYADVDSFIDHNILNLFAMNVDALRLSSFYHKTADSKLIAGPIWDFDRSLDSTDGRDNNPRTWYGTGDSTRYFNDSDRVMSWWPDMSQDPDYIQQYIDRWFELRENELSLENVYATIDKHVDEIRSAATRDFRRWNRGSFTSEIRNLKNWIEDRVEWIDSRWLSAPSFSVSTPQVPVGTEVNLTSSTGTVYYTLDGSDPRGDNASVSSKAIRATGPITIDEFTRITARVFKSGHGSTRNGYIVTGDDWSPPAEAVFFNDPTAAAGNLVVSEVNYNPVDPTAEEEALGFDNNDDFEFIELLNVSDKNVVLTGSQLSKVDVDGDTEGVSFDFSESDVATLAPGDRIVVVEDLAAFRARYGDQVTVAGEWDGALSNNRETLTMTAYDGSVIQQFSYNDTGLWPERADGRGSTLVSLDPAGNFNDPENWIGSVSYLGSPGAPDAESLGVVVNEVLAHTDPPLTPPDSIELFNTLSEPVDISGWYLSDSANQMLKYQIPNGTVLPAGGYVVFDEGDFNPTPLNPAPNHFALSSARGDDVWLVVAENGKPSLIADDVHFGATPNGESLGRLPNGTGILTPMSELSLGSVNSGPRVGPVIMSEVHYHPGSPAFNAQILDPSITSDDLEFIEVYNPTGLPVDLTDWRIRGGVDYDFIPGTQLASGSTIVVIPFNPDKPENVNRLAAFRAHHRIDQSVKLVGGFGGQLNDLGEAVRLQRPDEPPAEDPNLIPRLLEDQVVYDVVAPWPDASDNNRSLTRAAVSAYGNDPSSWKAEIASPGQTAFVVGPIFGDMNQDGRLSVEDIDLVCSAVLNGGDETYDLNADGNVDVADVNYLVEDVIGTNAGDVNIDRIFNSTDLIIVFTAGEYEDGVAGNSLWSTGDWNCDGEFDTSDLVTAFQTGSYQLGAAPGAQTAAVTPDLFLRQTGQTGREAGEADPAIVTMAAQQSPAPSLSIAARDLVFNEQDGGLNDGYELDDLDLELLLSDDPETI